MRIAGFTPGELRRLMPHGKIEIVLWQDFGKTNLKNR